MAVKLHEYCSERAGYEDIVKLCAPHLGPKEAPGTRSLKSEDGYVYLIKSGRHFKIGRTNAAGRREYELAIQLPERPKAIHVIRTDDPNGIEAYWHRRFESKRRGGEWFELDAEDVKAFKKRKFM